MQVNNLEGREVLIIGFGGVILLTVVVLSSIYVGHAITTTSSVPQPVHVSAAAPVVNVHPAGSTPPKIEVMAAPAAVNVHVPTAAAPVVNVSTPPATVTVVERSEKAPETKAAPQQQPKVDTKAIPVTTPSHSDGADGGNWKDPAKQEIGIEALYAYAEKYVTSYCVAHGLDPAAEQRKWTAKWNGRVDTAVKDGGSEQSLMDRVVIDSRDCFDITASPDRIVEGCRLLIRMRDAKLAMLQAMKDAMTRENLQKTVALLSAGAK